VDECETLKLGHLAVAVSSRYGDRTAAAAFMESVLTKLTEGRQPGRAARTCHPRFVRSRMREIIWGQDRWTGSKHPGLDGVTLVHWYTMGSSWPGCAALHHSAPLRQNLKPTSE
jgi:hypothetical protein